MILCDCFVPSAGSENQVHVFMDASAEAYAAVVYLTTGCGKNRKYNLIFSKSQLTPLQQKLTIPQLELMAAWIGVKAVEFVRNNVDVPVHEYYGWSDSKCLLGWLRTKHTVKLPVFVRNRAYNIKQSNLKFDYVPSASNPPDIATRGMKLKDFKDSDLWWHAPS
uniref:RT_RNaseH_2 domain-containing protein n=1 Tax=Syphacia muris TaxID=451379 RepID=A0A0N5AYE3_9BILA